MKTFSLSFSWHLSFFVFCSNWSVLCISSSVLEARKQISLANTLISFEHGKEYQVTSQFIVGSLFSQVPTLNLEKAMAPHSSTLAWKIPWTEEPGGLQFMGSQGVGHDWAMSLSLFTFLHWRRKWQPTPVFLPGESQGRRSLVGCSLWGRTESDMTEAT